MAVHINFIDMAYDVDAARFDHLTGRCKVMSDQIPDIPLVVPFHCLLEIRERTVYTDHILFS